MPKPYLELYIIKNIIGYISVRTEMFIRKGEGLKNHLDSAL